MITMKCVVKFLWFVLLCATFAMNAKAEPMQPLKTEHEMQRQIHQPTRTKQRALRIDRQDKKHRLANAEIHNKPSFKKDRMRPREDFEPAYPMPADPAILPEHPMLPEPVILPEHPIMPAPVVLPEQPMMPVLSVPLKPPYPPRRPELGEPMILSSRAMIPVLVIPPLPPQRIAIPPTEQDFEVWKQDFGDLVQHNGITPQTIERYLKPAKLLPKVIESDRKQPEFTRSFGQYMQGVVTNARAEKGRALWRLHQGQLQKIENQYGVPAQYLLAFWGIETNFGATKGATDTIDALATLAYDTRRSAFFAEQLTLMLKILQKEQIESPKGSWAGAFGHFQFMPSTFYQYAVDGNQDGIINVYESFDDALASAANYLNKIGWQKDQSWGRPVILTNADALAHLGEQKPIMDWVLLGVLRADNQVFKAKDMNVMAELVLPDGANGPAFLVYHNFNVIKRWNKSDFYALAVGVLADKIVGRQTLDVAQMFVSNGLTRQQIQSAQAYLKAHGYYDGEPDGIMGSATKAAIKAYQQAHNLPADGFLSKELLEKFSK